MLREQGEQAGSKGSELAPQVYGSMCIRHCAYMALHVYGATCIQHSLPSLQLAPLTPACSQLAHYPLATQTWWGPQYILNYSLAIGSQLGVSWRELGGYRDLGASCSELGGWREGSSRDPGMLREQGEQAVSELGAS